jgi:hypothetical protein
MVYVGPGRARLPTFDLKRPADFRNPSPMRIFVTLLGLSALLPWSSYAQGSSLSGSTGNVAPGIATADQATDSTALNQRAIELKTQFELLSQLAQEHKKRAQETPPDQTARSQWETDLAKELSEKAAGILTVLNNVHQRQVAFERAQTNLVSSVSETAAVSSNSMGNADETAFLGKVDERLAAVQQEIAEALETGKLYTAQLLTNKTSEDVSRTTFLLESNGDDIKRLRKEVFDLELKKLEFRALRQR